MKKMYNEPQTDLYVVAMQTLMVSEEQAAAGGGGNLEDPEIPMD